MESSGYMPRSGIAGSSGSVMPSFLRNRQTDFQSGCTSLQSHQQWKSVPLSPHPCQHLLSPEFLILAILIDKRIDSDISPKPTIFLPSVAEINLRKGGTCLCLLENFFPDIIRVYWKEKDGDKILESQEGNTMKTNDRYMKLSWLTVTEDKMEIEHSCIVKHEKNKRGDDQEILFPPIGKVLPTSLLPQKLL
ncbi:T-cell receptor gamma chain C region 5/10-13 [Apodemus speciosus]